jgi:hypothetical protein
MMTLRKNISGRFCFAILLIAVSVFFPACYAFTWNAVNQSKTINKEAPKNLRVSSITSDSAVILWNPVTEATMYEITWKSKEEEYGHVTTIGAEANSYKINDLLNETEYMVKIAAMFYIGFNGANQYTMSDYVSTSFKTLKDIPPSGELAKPGNVKANFNKDKSAIIISWNAVEGAAYYDINLKSDELYFHAPRLNVLNTVAASKTEYIYSGFLPESRIVIKVAARNSDFSDSCRWSYEVEIKK